MINPKYMRRKIVREYGNVPILLRKLFNIPNDEIIISFEWDKSLGTIKIETILDYNSMIDI